MNDEVKKASLLYLAQLQKFKNNNFDVHKDNLIKKLQNTICGEKSASFKTVEDIRLFIEPYIEFRTKTDSLVLCMGGERLEDLQVQMVNVLQKYKDAAYNMNNGEGGPYFTSQSKYEPTILEEFMGFLLSPLMRNLHNIKCGPVKAYSEMNIEVSIDENNLAITNLAQKTKNQDFSIYTEKEISSDGLILQIPLISIECKTYIDKTMLEGSINTAKRIKSGNPKGKFYVVSETWDLSENETVNPNEIDNVFIIRKCKRRTHEAIDANVVKDIFNTIKNDLLGLKLNTRPLDQIKKTGKLKL